MLVDIQMTYAEEEEDGGRFRCMAELLGSSDMVMILYRVLGQQKRLETDEIREI
jgi:hypothetical protein